MVRVYAKEPVNYFQDGGMQAPQQQMDPQQLMQIIQMFAEVTGNDPEQVMAQFQQLDAETQMQAVNQMVQTIQSEQAAQAPEPMPGEGMPAGEGMQGGMPASEAEAQMMGAPGEGQMAEQMMRMGGMYAKSQKKLLKKAVGGTLGKKGDSSKSIQEKLGEAVRSAIGLNFTENLIDNSAQGFNQRNTNQFSPGGTAPNNTYFDSANQMAQNSFQDQMSSNWLFDERLQNALDPNAYDPYLKIKGKALGDGYNMFNRPKFTQNVFGADIESSGYGALFPENIPSQKRGGTIGIPLFQNAGETDLAKLEQAQKDQVIKLSEAHSKGMISDAEYMETMNKLDTDYETATTPKKGVAEYDDKVEGTGYDYNLRWKGNLDKATENLYLKGADAKYGIWGSNGFLGMRPGKGNIRKMSLTFGERGTGLGTPGETPAVNGEANSRIDSKGRLLYDQPTSSTFGDVSDARLARMEARGERRTARNRDRYARIFGEDAAAEQFADDAPVVASSNFGTGPYAGIMNYVQQQQDASNQAAAGAQTIMNIGTQGTTGNYMDQFGQNPMGYKSGGLTRAQDGIPTAPAPASSTNVVMPRTGPASMTEAIAEYDLYNQMLALQNDPTAVVGFANPNPGLMQDSIFYYPGQTTGNFTPYQIGRDRNNNVLYGVSDNPPSLRQMVKYGNTTTGEAGVGQSRNTYIDIAGPNSESRYLPMYKYSGRPNVLYMKSPNGKWLINTEGNPDGEFVPIKDPDGKRAKTLNSEAYRDYSFDKPSSSFRFGGMTNFGYGLPLAIDGISNFESDEDKFKITMKEKSGAASEWAPVVMAGIQNFSDSVNTARALNQRNLAFNPALNNPVVPGDMVGSLGSFTSTTGPSVFMPNQMQGMMQGRFGAAQPAQMEGMYYTQFGGQPDLSGYGVGDEAYMTDQEIEAFMRMGGRVEYY